MSFEGTRSVLIKDLSGNFVSVASGGSMTATAAVSGQTVALWGASGRNSVYLTNQAGTTPIAVDASGRLAVNNPIGYSTVFIPATLVVTGNSGGVALASGGVDLVTITNIGLSGTAIFVGTSGDPPFAATAQSGKGFRLFFTGTNIVPPVLTIPTLGNANNIKVVSNISGEPISYMGVQ